MNKNFSFKGIVRNNDNILANEGECLELVNMRFVDGSLRPIPEMVERAVLPESYSAIYWHDKAACYICVGSNAPQNLSFYDSEWKVLVDGMGERLDFPMLEGVKSVEFLGYIVICMTENGIRYLLFADGTYRWLGEYPPVPKLTIGLSSKLHEITTDTAFPKSYVNTAVSSTWGYNSRGYFDECISKANKAGYYVDRALFRFALRLYDGSYIYCSNIIYVSDENEIDGVARDSKNLTSITVTETDDDARYKVKVLSFKPEFKFSALELENWKGIVVGIDIFTSGSIMGKKIGTAINTSLDTETKQRVTERYEVYRDKEVDEIWNEVNDVSLFYKIAEYDINGNVLSAVDDVSQANIVLQDALSGFEQNAFYTSVVPDCCYMFNNRLHIASLRDSFFKGYDRFAFLPAGVETAVAERLAVMTRIKTQNGISEVMNCFDDIEVGYKNGNFLLPPLLMYPDSRAFEMRLFFVYDSETFVKSFPLTPHKYLNHSQYLNKIYLGYDVSVSAVFASGKEPSSVSKEDVLNLFGRNVGVHEVVYSAEKQCWLYKGAEFPPAEYASLRVFQIPRDIADGDKIVFTIKKGDDNATFVDINNIPFDDSWKLVIGSDDYDYKESNVYEERENVMKVSMVDNPFVFPAKCTYPMSQGKIMAIATNKTAMSEGQFGEHPLYIFSKEGIQVLAVDSSGTVAYSNIYPVSHEVCQNPDCVCGTDSGVLFSGTQGVMLISGNRCVRLSVAMDNDCKELETVKRSGIIGRIASLNGNGDVVDATHFIDFMRTAKVARFPQMNELIFCNENYNYCYVYSMSANVWSKMSKSLAGFVTSGGELNMFCHKGDNTHIYVPGDMFSGKNTVLLITRPLLFGTKLPKRIMQLVLHAYLAKPENVASTTPFFSCLLLCSNDGVNFKLVSGCEKYDETQDVLFPYFPTCSYRYYIFALSGELDSKSMITGLGFDVCSSWNNRIR